MNITQADRAGHTPGPWSVNTQHANIEIRGPEESGVIVARMVEWGIAADTPSPQAANARLIAAAPELLDALKVAYIAMQHMGNVLNNIDAVDEKEDAQHDAAFEAVSLAIARATGAAA